MSGNFQALQRIKQRRSARARGGSWRMLAVGALVSVACGDNLKDNCVSLAEHTPADGLFATPESLLYEGCEPGAMTGFEAGERWFYEQDNRRLFGGYGPVRIERSCEEGLSLSIGNTLGAERVPDAFLSEDYLFWRREREFPDFGLTIVESYVLCNRLADGTYVGRQVRCNIEAGGEDCEPTGLVLRPFERLAGESESEGLELLSEYRGEDDAWGDAFTATVRVLGDVAYVVLGDSLRIVDIQDLAAPRELGASPAREGESYNDVKLVETDAGIYALIASNERGMLVIDVTEPNAPREVVAVTPSGEAAEGIHTLFTEEIDGKVFAYLADGVSNVVSIWDVSAPEAPVRAGAFEAENTDWAVHDLYAEGGRLYLNATVGGMLVVDTQPDPSASEQVARFAPPRTTYSHSNWVTETAGRKVSVHGDEGYDAKFKVVDVDPNSSEFMTEIGRYQTRPQVSAHNVMAFGSKAYAAYYQDGLRILDLSSPEEPTLEAYFNTWQPASAPGGRFEGAVGLDVDLERNLVFVADHPRGLLILRETGSGS